MSVSTADLSTNRKGANCPSTRLRAALRLEGPAPLSDARDGVGENRCYQAFRNDLLPMM
jgi:hypothetical protein